MIDVDVLVFNRRVAENKLDDAFSNFASWKLLDGLHITADEFEYWLEEERIRLQETVADSLHAYAVSRIQDGKFDEAIGPAKRLVEIDTFREDGHRLLIKLYLRTGRRSAAMRQYQTCASLLKAELGIEPEIETTRLIQTIKGTNRPHTRATERPIVSIRRFENFIGNDHANEFANGLTEEIVTELSRYRWYSTTLSNESSINRKHRNDGIRCDGPFEARYVLDGNARRVNGRNRITARLSDAASGRIVWANSFNCDAGEKMDAQTDIARMITAQIVPEITDFERSQTVSNTEAEGDAWMLWQQGLAHYFRCAKGRASVAKNLFQASIDANPEFAPAYASMALAEENDAIFEHVGAQQDSLDRGMAMARMAVTLDPRDCLSHYALGRMFIRHHDIEAAIVEMETAVELCPSFALARHGSGSAKYYNGQPKHAVLEHLSAARLSPADPELWAFYHMQARSLFDLGQYEQAVTWAERACRQPNAKPIALATYAASHRRLANVEKASAIIRHLRARDPALTIDCILQDYGNENIAAEMSRLAETLHESGLR